MNQTGPILVISLDFAPSTVVGAKRFSFLSAILQHKYPELHVLTIKTKYLLRKDNSIPSRGTVHRTAMLPPFPKKGNSILRKMLNRLWVDYLCPFDPFGGWILPAFVKGLKIIIQNRIGVIIATGPPFSTMVVGFLLSRATNTKLILDFRDPWSHDNTKYFRAFWRKVNKLFHILSLKSASALVFTSQIMQQSFGETLGKYSTANLHVITNGFHKCDNISPVPLGRTKKTMIYAGTLYGQRRISLLAKPLSNLLNDGSISKHDFSLHIFGTLKHDDIYVIQQFGLQEMIQVHDPVPHRTMLKYMKGADILFLPSGSDVAYAIPFKFFDYLSVRRPIFAVAPENSAMADLMKEIDCGRLADLNGTQSIQHTLRLMLLEDGQQYTFSGSERYTWEKVSQTYMQVIDKVLTSKRRFPNHAIHHVSTDR